MHFPARNQTSLGSALLKKLLPGRLPSSVGISGVCRGMGRGGFLSLGGCEAQGLAFHRPLRTNKFAFTTQSGARITRPLCRGTDGTFHLVPGHPSQWGVEVQAWSWVIGGRFWYEKQENAENLLNLPMVNSTKLTWVDQKPLAVANLTFQRPWSDRLPALS